MNLDFAVKENSIVLRLPERSPDSQLQQLIHDISSDLMMSLDEAAWDKLFDTDAVDVPLPAGSWRHLLRRIQRSYDFWRKPENQKRHKRAGAVYDDTPLTFTVDGVVYHEINKIPGSAEEVTSLGSFELQSSTMLATDPCYSKGTWCAIEFEALPGTWHAQLTRRDDTFSGLRNAILTIAHEDVPLSSVKLDEMEELDGDVGVDSGQAGFFEKARYPDEPDAEPVEASDQSDANRIELVRIDDNGNIVGEPGQPAVEALSPDAAPPKPQLEPGRVLLDLGAGDDDIDIDTEESGQTWYEQVCDVTLDDMGVNAGIAPGDFGVVSQTFYGDGGYPCFVKKNAAGQVIAAILVFDDSTCKDDEDEEDE